APCFVDNRERLSESLAQLFCNISRNSVGSTASTPWADYRHGFSGIIDTKQLTKCVKVTEK
ncbi:MAG TPA: hypothetical protein P5539_05425, partial [Mesotoga sp.]|nr:hypothetical protein [Mesotoga sp.]